MKNIIKYVTTVMTLLFLLAGCDDSKTNNNTIYIATHGGPKPYSYYDKSGNLTGFDIEVTKAIFAKLPHYQTEYVVTEFSSIMAGLDSGRYHIGANNFVVNEQRREKYYFSLPIFVNHYVIAVAEGRDDINSLRDVHGKSVEVTPGINYATALEKYNSRLPANEPKIVLHYTEADLLANLLNVESGKIDFHLISQSMLQQFIREHNLKLKIIPLSEADAQIINTNYSSLLIAKSPQGEQLVKEINEIIKALLLDGTIRDISYQYLEGDYTPALHQILEQQ